MILLIQYVELLHFCRLFQQYNISILLTYYIEKNDVVLAKKFILILTIYSITTAQTEVPVLLTTSEAISKLKLEVDKEREERNVLQSKLDYIMGKMLESEAARIKEEKERLQKEREERDRLELERLQKEKEEKDRLEQQQLQKEQEEKERAEILKREQEEKERLEKERLKKEEDEKAQILQHKFLNADTRKKKLRLLQN